MELKDATSAVLILVSIALLIGIGIVVIDKLGENEVVATTSIQSFNVNTSSAQLLSNRPVTSITLVINSTDATDIIPATNYTLSANTLLISDISFNGTGVNATYVYSANTTARDDILSASAAIGDFATDWMATIVVIIAAAIILGLVMGAFRFKR